jgi:kinesin family protein 5
MNAHSSRSHAILIVKIEKSYIISPEKIKELAKESNETIMNERVMTKSMLFLVDLAGSERVKKTKAEAMRLEEAKKINFSLLVLGNCIQALTDPKCSHISYRDSKLTRLLQESLGGNAKTSLIVTISPALYNLDETNSTLMFGSRAMKVQNKPTINKTVDYQALSIKLQEDLDKLNDEYLKLKIDYDNMSDEFNKYKSAENFMEISKMADQQQKLLDTSNNTTQPGDQNYNQLLAEHESVVKNLSYYEDVVNKMDGVFLGLEDEITQLKEDLKKFKDNNNELKSIIKEMEQEKMGIQDTVTELESKNESLLKINEELTKNTGESNLIRIEMNRLKELINDLENEKEALSLENKQLKGKIDHSAMIKDEISTSLDVIKNDYQKVKSDNKNYKNYIKELEESKEDILKQYHLLKIKNEELQRIKSDLDKTLEDLKIDTPHNLSTLDSSLVSKNTTSSNDYNPINKIKGVMSMRMSSSNLKGLLKKEPENISTFSLGDLKNEYLRLKEDNEVMKGRVSQMETQAASFNKNDAEKDSQIQTQDSVIKKLKLEVKALRDTVQENQGKMELLEKTITDLNIKIDEIEVEKHRIKSGFDKIKFDFEGLKKLQNKPKKDESAETDNDSYNKAVIEIAIDQKLILSNKDIINISILEKIIANFRTENSKLRKEHLEKNSEISNYINKALEAENATELLNKQIDELEKRVKLNEKLKQEAENKHEKLLDTIKQFETEKEALNKSLRLITYERDEIKKQKDQFVNSSNTADREYDLLKDTTRKQIMELTSKLSDLESLKNGLETKIIEYKNQLKETEKENNVNKEDLSKFKENNNELKSIIKELEKEKTVSLNKTKELESKVEDLRQANEELTRDTKDLNLIKTDLNRESKNLRETVQERQDRIEQLEKTIADLNIKIDELEVEKLRVKNSFDKISTEYDNLKKKHSVARKDESAETDNEIYSKIIIEIALDQKLINSNKDLVNIFILEKVITNLNSDVINLRKQNLEKETELKNYLNKALNADKNSDFFKQKIDGLEQKLQEYKENNEKFSTEIEKIKDEKIELNKKLKLVTFERDEIKSQNEQLLNTNNTADKEYSLCKENSMKQISDLTFKLKDLEAIKTGLENEIIGYKNKPKEEEVKLKSEQTKENKEAMNKTTSNITKHNIHTQTDNLSYSNKVLDIAIQTGIISKKEVQLSHSLLEKLVGKIFENYNNANISLNEKTEACNKLMQIQKTSRKTIDDLEAYKKKVTDALTHVHDYDKLKEELAKIRTTKSKDETLQNTFQEKVKLVEGELESARKSLDVETSKNKIKDMNYGIFLVKNYFNQTKTCLEDFYRVLGNKTDK